MGGRGRVREWNQGTRKAGQTYGQAQLGQSIDDLVSVRVTLSLAGEEWDNVAKRIRHRPPHPHRCETTMTRRRPLSIERLEARSLSTLVFVFNGNGFAEATPNQLTQNTAALIDSRGDRAIQLTMPAMNGPGQLFYQVASEACSLIQQVSRSG